MGVRNEWKVKSAKECDKFVEDTDALFCKFPPPIVNKWEKIQNVTTKRYRPTPDDMGRQLLLECTPTIKSEKDKEKEKKEKDKDDKDDKDKKKEKEKNNKKSKKSKDDKG